jgi:H+-transporting ATPase
VSDSTEIGRSTVESAGSVEALFRQLGADPVRGLSRQEADRRRVRYGGNVIHEAPVSPALKFLSYFWGPIPWMIEAAALLSFLVREWSDFSIIVVMLLINAGVGFWQEHKAESAIALLKQKLALRARVRRDDQWKELPAEELVPGDIILVKLGDIIPADVMLLEGDGLSVDQSVLTGESLPADKRSGETAYSGSIARMGEMTALVTATGMGTYFGKTAKLVERAGTVSHFQRAVLRIGNVLILSTVGLVTLILLVALFRHDPLVHTILFALILTVAAIPVALPAVLSVTMAVGAERLAGMKAIVSKLVAIEEMAGVDVLCSDKTGTLTRNALTLGEPAVIGARDQGELILAAALASRSDHDDPIDAAILHGLADPAVLKDYAMINFHPFDPISKRAEAEVVKDGTRFKMAKGAPQVILELAQPDDRLRHMVADRVDALASEGYRTLGVARTDVQGQWQFLGLLPLFDPPRDDSAATIEAATQMGIHIKMITGDHLAIARRIAARLKLGHNILPADAVFGLEMTENQRERVERADGFAQVFPEHKFEIVKLLQKRGHIVGMTGDGVNDAPALK